MAKKSEPKQPIERNFILDVPGGGTVELKLIAPPGACRFVQRHNAFFLVTGEAALPDEPVVAVPAVKPGIVAQQRAQPTRRQPTAEDPPPPPVVPTPAEEARLRSAADAAEVDDLADDDDVAPVRPNLADYADAREAFIDENPPPARGLAPKSPIDRSRAQSRALRPVVSIGGESVQVDLTTAVRKEAR